MKHAPAPLALAILFVSFSVHAGLRDEQARIYELMKSAGAESAEDIVLLLESTGKISDRMIVEMRSQMGSRADLSLFLERIVELNERHGTERELESAAAEVRNSRVTSLKALRSERKAVPGIALEASKLVEPVNSMMVARSTEELKSLVAKLGIRSPIELLAALEGTGRIGESTLAMLRRRVQVGADLGTFVYLLGSEAGRMGVFAQLVTGFQHLSSHGVPPLREPSIAPRTLDLAKRFPTRPQGRDLGALVDDATSIFDEHRLLDPSDIVDALVEIGGLDPLLASHLRTRVNTATSASHFLFEVVQEMNRYGNPSLQKVLSAIDRFATTGKKHVLLPPTPKKTGYIFPRIRPENGSRFMGPSRRENVEAIEAFMAERKIASIMDFFDLLFLSGKVEPEMIKKIRGEVRQDVPLYQCASEVLDAFSTRGRHFRLFDAIETLDHGTDAFSRIDCAHALR